MQLDNDTRNQLGYNNNISERPQDWSEGYDIVHQDTLIFDEEYDISEQSFSLVHPQVTEEYAVWLSSFIYDELNFFSKEEAVMLSWMLDMVNEALHKGKTFSEHKFHTVRKWIQNHTV